MARLYVKTNTDAIKTTHTARGHQEVTTSVYWGSRHDSRLAADMVVRWAKDTDKPTIQICAHGGLNIEVIK